MSTPHAWRPAGGSADGGVGRGGGDTCDGGGGVAAGSADRHGAADGATWHVSTLHRQSQRMSGAAQDDDDGEEDISFGPRATTHSKLETISAAQIGALVRLLYVCVAVAAALTTATVVMIRTQWINDTPIPQSFLTAASNGTLIATATDPEFAIRIVDRPLTDPCPLSLVLGPDPAGPPPSPDPCVTVRIISVAARWRISILALRIGCGLVTALLAIVFAVRVFRHRGRRLVTHEQVWVLLLLVGASLHFSALTNAFRLAQVVRDFLLLSYWDIPDGSWHTIYHDHFVPTLLAIKDASFTVSTLFVVWANFATLRILDPRARLGWRFYLPKVLTLATYFALKVYCNYRRPGARSSEVPLVAFALATLIFARYDLWEGRGALYALLATVAVMELGILVWIVREALVTRRVLQGADYMASRSKQVTFRWFVFSSAIFYLAYSILSAIVVFLTPPGVYFNGIVAAIFGEARPLQFYIIPDLVPGLDVLFTFYVTVMMYVNLPADSHGLLGWFRGQRTYGPVPADAGDYSETFTERSDSTRTLPSARPLHARMGVEASEASEPPSLRAPPPGGGAPARTKRGPGHPPSRRTPHLPQARVAAATVGAQSQLLCVPNAGGVAQLCVARLVRRHPQDGDRGSAAGAGALCGRPELLRRRHRHPRHCDRRGGPGDCGVQGHDEHPQLALQLEGAQQQTQCHLGSVGRGRGVYAAGRGGPGPAAPVGWGADRRRRRRRRSWRRATPPARAACASRLWTTFRAKRRASLWRPWCGPTRGG
eukprot:TRINITY_DN2153_c0_g1_i7.p1 TRINITY_DN2153_c0_g1~~TRINITY_DN2153_c0_g1_i7.p1  ORF type:complete len:770 (-),score=190.59 TRINITY_DN2153_c0_g1_i7:355-2664(-)